MADAGVDGYGPAAGCVTLRFYAELNEFLPKPFGPTTLLERVRVLLSRPLKA